MSDTNILTRESVNITSGNIQEVVTLPVEIPKIEFSDTFNSNSAVLLPYDPRWLDDVIQRRGRGSIVVRSTSESLEQIIGIRIICSVYKFLEQHPNYRIIIAGHTDLVGSVSDNFKLSELRAKSVLHLLMGEKNEWIDIVFEKHTIKDIQTILKYYFKIFNWQCDPGRIDGILGNRTRNALRSFQESFNANRAQFGLEQYPEIPIQNITNNKLNKETWEAIYALFILEISRLLNCSTDESELNQFRERIKFIKDDCKVLACGESFPIIPDEQPSSTFINRRVEVLFVLEEDIPDFECLTEQEEIFSIIDCPFYNFDRFSHNQIEPLLNYIGNIELQTVDQLGTALGNVNLILRHQQRISEDIELTTDSEGYWSRENVSAGIYNVLYPDGSPVRYEFAGEIHNATINTTLVQRFVSRIIIREQQNESSPDEIRPHRRLYHRGPDQPRASIEGRGGEELINRRSMFYTTDNIALAAGFGSENNSVNVNRLLEVLDEWLQDYYPIVCRRGYFVNVIENRSVRVYDDQKNLRGSFNLTANLLGAFGAYSAFQHDEGLFLDMTSHNSIIPIEGSENESYELQQIMNESDSERYNSLFNSFGTKFNIVYKLPSGAQLYALCVTGGMGRFEDYPSNPSINNRIHQRNLAVARTINSGYPAVLRNYINRVNSATSEDEIRALGPPQEPYQFPKPLGATLDQYRELLNALGTNSFRAWVAIAQRLDVLAGRIPDGTMFFRVKFSLSERVEVDSTSPYEEVKVEWNFDISEHGTFSKRSTTLTQGIQLGGGTGSRQIGVGANHEIDVESGDEKITVNAKFGDWGIEASDDGTRKVTGPFGISSEGNIRTGEMGFGGTLSTHNLFRLLRERGGQQVADDAFRNVPNAELYVGLHFQGLREENVLAVVSRAPGFFERRSVQNLLAQTTQWTDLNLDERTRLETLGWNQDLWDRKYLIPLSQFPESARTNPYRLNGRQRIAVVHLGISFDQWLNTWRTISRT